MLCNLEFHLLSWQPNGEVTLCRVYDIDCHIHFKHFFSSYCFMLDIMKNNYLNFKLYD